MAFNAIDNTRVNAAKHQDDWYAAEVVAGKEIPYASLAAAYVAIPSAVRMKGRSFIVTENGLTVEYWWKDDLTTAIPKGGISLVDKNKPNGVVGSGSDEINGVYYGMDPTGVEISDVGYGLALQASRDLGKRLFIPGGVYLLNNPPKLKAQDSIRGSGPTKTQFKLAPLSTSPLLSLFDLQSYGVSISGIKFNGNASAQTTDTICFQMVTDFATIDAKHSVKNIVIENVRGDGFLFKGRGDSKYNDITVLECSGKTGVIDTYDSSFTDIISGRTLGGGLDVINGSNRLNNVKVWISRYGINVTGSNNNLVNIDCQDVLSYGLRVAGQLNTFMGLHVDSVGYLRGELDENATAIIGTSAAQYTEIYGVVRDRKQFYPDGSLNYALDWLGVFSSINLMVRDIKLSVYKNESTIPLENNILIRGTGNTTAGTDIVYLNRDRSTSRLISRNLTTGTNATEWMEVMRFKVNNGFDASFLLQFTGHATAQGQTAQVLFFAKVATNTVSAISAKLINFTEGSLFDYDSFKITNDGPTEFFIISVKKISIGGRLSISEVSNALQNQNAVQVIYNSNPIWTTTEPIGLNQSTTDSTPRFGSKNLLSISDFAGTPLSTGNTVDLLKTITSPLTVTYDTSFNFKWASRFIVNPTDKVISTSGFIDLVMPAAGVVIAGIGSTPSVTVTSSGIPLSAWACLIAEYTIGGTQTSFVYKIGQFGSMTANSIKPNQILIAQRNNDTFALKLATGQTLKPGDSIYNARVLPAISTSTNTNLQFIEPTVYGSITTPISGNITAVNTDARLGTKTLVIHNSSTAPTFDTKFKKRSDSMEYVPNVVNYIECEWLTTDYIIYKISQQKIDGSFKGSSKPVVSSTTLSLSDYGNNGQITIYADATGGAFTITLLPAGTALGYTTKIVKTDASANTVTVKGSGSELINNANTDTTLSTQNSSFILESNGTKHFKF